LCRVLVRREDAELVVADSERLVDVVKLAGDNAGNRGQHAVARLVAVGVVDLAQAVDVNQRQCKRVLIALMLGQQDSQPLVEMSRPRQPRQRVVARPAAAPVHQVAVDGALDVAERLRQPRHRLGEVPRLGLGHVAAKRLDQQRL
jgi:hypothetical protein